MTRTKSPHEASGGPRGILTSRRFAFLVFLMVLIGVVALSLGWAAISLNESGAREAQAQTSPEIAQSQSSQSNDQGSGGGSGGSGQEDYAAFGEKGNPFARVVALAESEGGDEENGVSDDDTNNGGGGNRANPDDDFDESGDDNDQTQSFSNGDANGNDTLNGQNGELDNRFRSEDGFEQRIREEERREDDSGFDAQSGRQGNPGSGGSGRSGTGEPADEFRNGGGGIGK